MNPEEGNLLSKGLSTNQSPKLGLVQSRPSTGSGRTDFPVHGEPFGYAQGRLVEPRGTGLAGLFGMALRNIHGLLEKGK